MRVIDSKMIKAIENRKNLKLDNTEVEVDSSGNICIYLFGNNIANIYQNGSWNFSNSGYNTNTTKERLNVILDHLKSGLRIVQRNWAWYLYKDGRQIKQLDNYFRLNQNLKSA